MKSNSDYLRDLAAEVDHLKVFTREGKAAFLKDERTQYAVMMAYMRIGEIAKRLPDEWLNAHPEVEWRAIKGFRDVLIHRYDAILPERVWEVIEKLDILKKAVSALLAVHKDDSHSE